MIRFFIGKVLRIGAILLSVTLLTFLLMHAIPGNPWSNYANSERAMSNVSMDKATQRQLEHRFGLDLPLWRQFTRYVVGDFDEQGEFFCGALCGNLGPSIQQRGRSVQNILFAPPEGKTFWASRFGYSVRLVLLGSLLVIGVGIPLGILSARRSRSFISRAISIGLAALIAVPNFVLGFLAIILLASWLKIINVLPDWGNLSSWFIPAIVLAAMPLASVARVTRASVLNIMNEDYIRTARAKGLSPARVMLVHVLRNALVPMTTFIGPALVEMLAGLLIVENIFSFPGFGREYWSAVLNLDYPMIMGVTLIYAVAVAFVNVLVQVFCDLLDPRISVARMMGAP